MPTVQRGFRREAQENTRVCSERLDLSPSSVEGPAPRPASVPPPTASLSLLWASGLMRSPLAQSPGRQWPGRWSQTFSFFHRLLHPITCSLYHLLLHLGRWLLFPKPQFPLLQIENSHHLPAEHSHCTEPPAVHRHAGQHGAP